MALLLQAIKWAIKLIAAISTVVFSFCRRSEQQEVVKADRGFGALIAGGRKNDGDKKHGSRVLHQL